MKYDILKPKEKTKSITLTRKFLENNLDLKDNEFVLQKNEIWNGKKVVILTKFDPAGHIDDNVNKTDPGNTGIE